MFGPQVTSNDIERAFSIDHLYEGQHFISYARVTLAANGDIEVRGQFYCVNGKKVHAGSFMRRLLKSNDTLASHHMTIRVEQDYQFKHIAKAHYQKALQFYLDVGIVRVFMEANQDGPAVWPGFGFDLLDSKQQDRLQELVEIELAKYEIPLSEAINSEALRPVAPLLLALEIEVPDGKGGQELVEIGQIAMRRLYLEVGEELRMACWLNNPVNRPYLEELGLRLPEP